MRAIPMRFQEYLSLIQSGSLHSVFIEGIGPRNGYNCFLDLHAIGPRV